MNANKYQKLAMRTNDGKASDRLIGNFRRYNKLSNTPIDKVCPVCGNNFQGLREIYCSPECSRRARERAVKENSKQYYQDHKKDSQ